MFRTISHPKLFYLGIFSFGLSLCFALQLSNHSNIFKILGLSNSQLPLLWLIPPITGFIIQPLIGQISDDTATRFGKRMPYLIGWGILSVIALIMLPFSTSILFALMISIILDCSFNGSNEALRALTNDITKKDNERRQALYLQGFFAGMGAAIGTNLPYLIHHLSFTNEKFIFGHLPDNLRYAFFIAAASLTIVLVFCFFALKEKIVKPTYFNRKNSKSLLWRIAKIFKDLFKNIRSMPVVFRRICLIHAISWIGLFIFWLYFSTFISQNFYNVPYVIKADRSLYINAWAKASLDTSFYFSLYQYVSIFYTLLLYFLPKSINIKFVHVISLFIGGISILLLNFETSVFALSTSFICIGIMWGSMITIPYAIIMQLLPKGKIGVYLGIFNMCITLPQLICGLTLPFFFKYIFNFHAAYLMLFSGMLFLMAAFLWFINDYSPKTSFIKYLRVIRSS